MTYSFFRKSTALNLTMIFLLAFFLRIATNIAFQGIASGPATDMGSVDDHLYDAIAKNILEGKGFSLNGKPTLCMTPGFPFLLAIFYYLSGVKYAVVRILLCLLGALTCINVYFIGKHIMSQKAGMIACCLLALYPPHLYYGSYILTETPWGFFLSLTVLYAILLQTTPSIKNAGLFGFFLSIASYIRPQTILFGIFYALLYCIINIKHLKNLSFIFISILILFFSLFPWILRNHLITGSYQLTTLGGENFFYGNNEIVFSDKSLMGSPLTKIPPDHYYKTETIKIKNPGQRKKLFVKFAYQAIKNHMKDIPLITLMKVHRALTPFLNTENKLFNLIMGLTWAFLFPFCLVGMILSFSIKKAIALHAVILHILFITVLFFGLHRYVQGISPILVVYASIPIQKILNKYCNRHL